MRQIIISPIREFITDSRAVGITLIVCTIVSLIISNSGAGENYLAFWNMELHMPAPNVEIPHTPLHLVNDFLMAVFFLLVGIEIKRELLVGELSSVKKSMLPIIAAIGGMAIPALIYLAWTTGNPVFSRGWGIPMATDIAFSLGVLSMLGKRAPFTVRVFLMALAIIDDLGGILTIAIFYAEEINWTYLFMGGGIMFVLTMLNLLKVKRYYIYMILGLLLWYMFFNSGVHATIAGVLLAFTIPLHKIEDLIHSLHDPVNFIILPIFALANTAIILPDTYGHIFSSVVHHGIFTGLVLGKPLGIFLFSWIAIKLGISSLPKGMNYKHLLGMGMIAGIGFTISIFMSTLAFGIEEMQTTAKVAIIGASVAAGLLGFLYLKFLNKREVKKVV
ncbi:MAG: Na+/H+ antiporter NhaA [Chitinophagaceae bacterium]|nr:Na+/H+ antiporter NhaA [Chitinophagaceae bacterium]